MKISTIFFISLFYSILVASLLFLLIDNNSIHSEFTEESLSLPTSSLDSVLTNYNIYVWHNSLENAGSLHIDLEDKKTKTVKHLAVTRLYDTIRTLATHHSNTYFFATFKR